MEKMILICFFARQLNSFHFATATDASHGNKSMMWNLWEYLLKKANQKVDA